MRPNSLVALNASITNLNGVGDKIKQFLGKLKINTVLDMALHIPSTLKYFPLVDGLKSCTAGMSCAIVVKIIEHKPPSQKGRPYKVYAVDKSGEQIEIIYFNFSQSIMSSLFKVGDNRILVGDIEVFMGQYQMTHPHKIQFLSSAQEWNPYESQYPLTKGLHQAVIQKLVHQALGRLPNLPEWLDKEIMEKNKWPTWRDAVLGMHNIKSESDLSENSICRKRLAFDELLAEQISLAIARKSHNKHTGIAKNASGQLIKDLINNLPFELTEAQNGAIAEILSDVKSDTRMMRLLQGDVGSGKTIVSLIVMLYAIEAGFQVALLAPTELLAQQHFQYISKMMEGLDITCDLLTGSVTGKKRTQIYEDLESGKINIIVGTHALIQDGVNFQSLGLVVIDEQHRFGVKQRSALAEKGDRVDVLVTTATPIPRTLMMTNFGDLTVSRILQKPEGRKPITTLAIPLSKTDKVFDSIRRIIEKGEKVYWVCPLIDESESVNLTAAVERFEMLESIFGRGVVEIMHGQMSSDEKARAMDNFVNGDCSILVSTTVIEVGVDVKEATIIVIDHAEHFGLAQLHQLRGRVGRNDKQSACILLYSYRLSEVSLRRIEVMRETQDGFKIAEEDLKLRGGGEIVGTKQSGIPTYRFADLLHHTDLLLEANRVASEVVKNNLSPEIETLLYLYGYDEDLMALAKAA